MAWGAQLFGENGNPQIDNMGAISMAYLGKGSITLNQQLQSNQAPSFNRAWRAASGGLISVAGARLYAFRARYDDRPVGVWTEFGSGDGRVVEFVGSGNADGTFPIVDWWAFGRPPANTETWGAVAWNDDGQRSWSSAGRPMRIAAYVNDGARQAINAAWAGNYAICVGYPMGAVRSGSETPAGPGVYRWLESRLMWGAPSSTGFAAPGSNAVLQAEANTYPTGRREGDMKATMLLVDVAGL